jgi:hypothetical protein
MNDITQDQLIAILKARFAKHPTRHPGIEWPVVEERLRANPDNCTSLAAMEKTGGEPDIIGRTPAGELIFCDCSPESPAGRRSLCYDRAALDGRKEHKPADSAVDLAQSMGIQLLDEAQYRELQTLGEFDLKTSSWIATPAAIRQLGGALFCDRRYNQVFVYHNGAESYYGARGFRGRISI